VTSRLAAILHAALNTAGIVAAVHLDRLGHVIHAPAWRTADLSAAGDRARGLLEQWQTVGRDLHAGGVVSMLLDRTSGPVVIAPLPGDATLLVMGDQDCRPGRVRAETVRVTAALAAVSAEEQAEPREAPAGDRAGMPADAAGDPEAEEAALPPAEPTAEVALADAHREAVSSERGGRAARTGEVVLLGAHTFRLVRKLVAQLLETKGVRTASLRAYSPVSTVVDVVLEEETTLAAIGPQDLQEFAVERTEANRSRLVLRPAKGQQAPGGA
jgi:hypothetical protein